MADGQSKSVKSCAYDDCERDVGEEEWCYWHREEEGKCPEDDLELDDGFPVDLTWAYLVEADLSEAVLGTTFESDRTPADLTDASLAEADLTDASLAEADLTGASLAEADLTDASLGGADLTDASLGGADLTDASLSGADLTDASLAEADLTDAFLFSADLTDASLFRADLIDADLSDADLTDADLSDADLIDAYLSGADLIDASLSGADLTDVSLFRADLTDASLSSADLTNADLRHTTLHRTDFREATITNLTLDRETTISDLPSPTDDDTTDQTEHEEDTTDDQSDEPEIEPNDWDEVARVYHALKQEFDANGFVTRARRYHRKERRARRHETRVEDGWFSRAHLAEFASGAITGYGVGVKRIAGIATALFALSTVTYFAASVENPLTYSAITFATAPPYGVRDLPLYARLIAGIETIFGTLLLITLGFVLSNREQF